MAKKTNIEVENTESAEKTAEQKASVQTSEHSLAIAENAESEQPETLTGDVVDITAQKYDLAKHLCESISKDLKDVANKTYAIAKNLYQIYEQELYKQLGFSSIYELADEKFGIKKTSVNNYINIVKNFGVIDENNICTEIKPEYQDYSPSQLVALSKATPETVKRINPEMSVRKIREIVNSQPAPTGNPETVRLNDSKKQYHQKCIGNFSDISKLYEEEYKSKLINIYYDFIVNHPDAENGKVKVSVIY